MNIPLEIVIPKLYHFSFDSYRFAACCRLTNADLQNLVDLFRSSDAGTVSVLGGRRPVSQTDLKEIGPVVIKHYRRGGILARFIEKTYLTCGKKRSQIEFEQMYKVRKLGVSTPEPIAYACKGRFFYQTWLITAKIEHHLSMAELSRIAPDRTVTALKMLGSQLSILIDNGVMHADFHPGNVLVDDREQVFLVDFDKSTTSKADKLTLKKRYLRRWNRSVSKHGLPKMLSEVLINYLGDF